jgi:uncharacterized SAM-binding protein YcdF (DUF218 family)
VLSSTIDLLIPGAIHVLVLLLGAAAYGFVGRAPPWHRWRRRLVGAAILVAAVNTPGLSNLLYVALEDQWPNDALRTGLSPDPGAVIVVLGSGTLYGGGPDGGARLDEHGWERTQGAVGLWRQIGGRLLFTGGPADAVGSTIGELMAQAAAEMGVPKDAIDAQPILSLSTYEDLLLVQQRLAADERSIWLVTSAAHMPRAMAVAARLGLHARAYAVDRRQFSSAGGLIWLPTSRGSERLAPVLHEIVGLAWYRLRGWAN